MCKQHTEGVAAYSSKAMITEHDSEDNVLEVQCAEGAGRSMFDMDAAAFANLDPAARAAVVEKICNVQRRLDQV